MQGRLSGLFLSNTFLTCGCLEIVFIISLFFHLFRSLESCAYSANILKETLNKIQKAVDDLSLRQYSNLHAWVGKLDEAVEAKLALRLQVIIKTTNVKIN